MSSAAPVRRIPLVLFALLVAVVTGCVTRQGPMAVERPLEAGPTAAFSTDGYEWRDHGHPNGGLGLPPEAWPMRLPMPAVSNGANGDGAHEPTVHLILPAQRAPDRREHIGSRGVGIVQRVLVEELTDVSSLARLRREQGFVEWLVVQTLRGELMPKVAPLPHQSDAIALGGVPELVEVAAPTIEPSDRSPRFRIFEAAETSFALYVPESEPRGLVLQMTNLAGNTDWERRLTQAFRADGWAVLSTFVPDGWALASSQQIDASDDPQELGRRIAAIVDDRLAEWAYGVEAVLEDLAVRRPNLVQRPLVGIGSSIGAMSMPAVSARLDRPFDALVLIAGGADTLSIMRSTTMSIASTPLKWRGGRRPNGEQWARIIESYRASTRLDALHTARLLRDVPVLQLHAEWDTIVPAASGDLLWEALGGPERWSYRSGHVGLLVFWLPHERRRIVEWVGRQIGREAED